MNKLLNYSMKNKKPSESKKEKLVHDEQPALEEHTRAEEARQEVRQYKILRMDHSG